MPIRMGPRQSTPGASESLGRDAIIGKRQKPRKIVLARLL
jgi:hypothetical protein